MTRVNSSETQTAYATRTAESNRIQWEQEAQDRGISMGMLLGLLVALLAAGIGSAIYFFGRTEEPATTTTPVERDTTIIERTVENNRVIERTPDIDLPDVQAPNIDVQAPEVNIQNPVASPSPSQPTQTAPPQSVQSNPSSASSSENADPKTSDTAPKSEATTTP